MSSLAHIHLFSGFHRSDLIVWSQSLHGTQRPKCSPSRNHYTVRGRSIPQTAVLPKDVPITEATPNDNARQCLIKGKSSVTYPATCSPRLVKEDQYEGRPESPKERYEPND